MNPCASELQERVSELIETYLPTGNCSIQAVASHLRIHRSTLNRRLARANCRYIDLLQKARKRRAAQLCLTPQSLWDIAPQLGFGSGVTLSRWFSNTFGCSVRAWRKRRPSL